LGLDGVGGTGAALRPEGNSNERGGVPAAGPKTDPAAEAHEPARCNVARLGRGSRPWTRRDAPVERAARCVVVPAVHVAALEVGDEYVLGGHLAALPVARARRRVVTASRWCAPAGRCARAEA